MIDDEKRRIDNEIAHSSGNGRPLWPALVALLVGIIAALMSIGLEYLRFTASEIAGGIIVAIISPGIVGAIAIGRNAHAFSLWIAAGINFIFYFFIVRSLCGVVSKMVSRKSKQEFRP